MKMGVLNIIEEVMTHSHLCRKCLSDLFPCNNTYVEDFGELALPGSDQHRFSPNADFIFHARGRPVVWAHFVRTPVVLNRIADKES
mmetsp:Transcript_16010/g.33476  ORF Transcript_16010/g.33476 Transcript_16010/m.33476 type:complete len:86 (-) Transcript_16010:51-308(-)